VRSRFFNLRPVELLILAALMLCGSALRGAQTAAAGELAPEHIMIGAGLTHLLDLPVNIERVSVSSPETAEAVPVTARSLMVNGKLPGETSLVIWLADGSRREYDVSVRIAASRIEAAQAQLEREFKDSVQMIVDNGAAYLSGRVRDMYEAQRAVSIAAMVGRVVNLLKVDLPPQERQVLLKVRFADVDRSKTLDLGISFVGAPAGWPFSATVGTYAGGTVSSVGGAGQGAPAFTLSDALNLFLFDPHINVGATVKALANQNILQILAEPNLLAMNGKEASFIAGGEFPYPTLQGGGAGVGQVTVSFREFGIKIHFLPTITPRGTIRLHVVPEVSSLDYSNALSTSGGTVPALNTRRVETEIELQDGQSFAIAGLLNNQTTEQLSKIPGLGDIPLFGKLFQTRSVNKQNSELMVIVTPELVEPIPANQPVPELAMPQKFLEGPGVLTQAPRTPGTDVTGPPPPRSVRSEISVQEMEQLQRVEQQQMPTAVPASTLPTVGVPGVNAPAAGAAPSTGGGAPAASPGAR
jgi:pilus assembly protein CpaC